MAVVGVGVALALVGGAQPAAAESFALPDAMIEVRVETDGSVTVTEKITYDFDGSFSGGYREIPLRSGESISDVSVSEAGGVYRQGGCTDLGCTSPAGTFGTRDLGGRTRVVWHYAATDEQRTFEIRYTLVGLAKVYDDYVDVYLQVWGPEWRVGLDHLTATMVIPAGAADGEVYVWGHPETVQGDSSLGPGGVEPGLEAFDVPSGQYVEFRVAFPRRLLESSDGGSAVAGTGLDVIREDEASIAQASEEEIGRIRRLISWAAVLAVVPALLAAAVIYARYGYEPRVAYDREYEQEPPGTLQPAEVAALLSQGKVDERGFTATVFDFIRRGIVEARPISTTRSTFLGLRHEDISDLELSMGRGSPDVASYEEPVYSVVSRILDEGPQPLHKFRERIREDASSNALSYRAFATAVPASLEKRGLFDRSGRRVVGWVAAGFIGLGILGAFIVAKVTSSILLGGVALFAVTIALMVNGLLFLAITGFRRVRVKRTKEGALEAARWSSFERYLRDFSRLEEAPAISLDLWDRYLVYAIAFGVASEVLATARIYAPAELVERSSIYWYGSHGFGGGSSENAFASLQSSLSGAFSPPSSSGGGGGFSGGSGGGGGGGGGGAW